MAAVMIAYPPRDSFQGYPQQYAMYQTRAHQPDSDMAQSLNVNPYANYAPVTETHQFIPPQPRSQQPSNLGLGDDGIKPSLPSISNLLDLAADGERSSQDPSRFTTQQAQMQTVQSSQYTQSGAQPMPVEQRQQQIYAVPDHPSTHRTTIPPTPPLRNDSLIEGTNSPSTISTGSSLSAGQPYFVGSALNNVEATDQRSIAAQQFIKRHSIPSQPNISPYGTSYNASPYSSSPGGASTGSFYSPSDPSFPPPSGIYSQRPLPSNFPPQSQQMPPPSAHPNSPPKVWEHHHYINPSSQAQFPQSPDRYICQTCNKAFSRPSSLKIHSHSHTGEKPFRCPHSGCGKAFSVRSNMKRHERGCHTPGGAGGGMSHMG